MRKFNRRRPPVSPVVPATVRPHRDDARRILRGAAFEPLELRRMLTVGVAANDANAAEAQLGTGKFRFTREDTVGALTVNFTVTGTATSVTDFATIGTSVSFANGVATADVTVTPVDDAAFEGNETVIVTIAESDDYEIDEDADSATVTIADNDKPTVSIAATDATAVEAEDEDDIETGTITLTRTGSTAEALAVKVLFTGSTATANSDYETIAGTLTIPIGESTLEVDVTPKDDVSIEDPETVKITLAADAAYTAATGASSNATVTITSDDLPVVAVTAADATAIEGSATDTGKFTITRTGPTTGALTVTYVMSGVGGNGTDYDTVTGTAVIAATKSSVDVIIKTKQDATVEPSETAILTLSTGMTYTRNDGSKVATVTIADDDKPTVSLTASDNTAVEAGSGGRFTFTRNGPTNLALVVPFLITGTATNGTDYKTIVTTVTIPAGATSTGITVKAKDDDDLEGPQTVILTLGTSTALVADTGAKTATVTIADDEVPDVSIVATDGAATEPLADKGLFTVTRNGPTTAALTVNLTISGTATGGTDYETIASTVVIPIGKTSATINVSPKNDETLEGTETVIVTLGDSADYDADGNDGAATVKLGDDEKPVITIAASDAAAAEASSATGTFTISRTGPTTEELKVNLALSGTSKKIDDYANIDNIVTIAAGAATKVITLTPVNDNTVEGDETAIATLVAAAKDYTLGSDKTATITIAENDKPTVLLTGTDLNATEAGKKVTLTVTRNGPTTAALSVAYVVTGTAAGEDGEDYTELTGTVSIPIGKTSATIVIEPKQDTDLEGRETVIVTLDDDSAPYLIDADKDDLTVQIADDEKPEISIVATDAAVVEGTVGNTGVITFSRSGSTADALEVPYTLTGTATTGTDTTVALPGKITFNAGEATKTITITGSNDSNYEGAETIIVTPKATPALYTIDAEDKTATVTITDDDKPTVSIVATKATVKEGGKDALIFTVSRTGVATAALVVAIEADGTASADDATLALPTTVTIPAGKLFSVVSIVSKEDTAYEGTETVTISVDDEDAAYVADGTADDASGTITDNDNATVTLTASDAAASEVSNATGTFTVTRTVAAADDLIVNLTLSGNAKNGKDYNSIAKTVKIPAGQASATITVTPKTDTTVEGNERVIETLAAGTGYVLGEAKTGTVTIADAQKHEVNVEALDTPLKEADTRGGKFRISRDGKAVAASLIVQFALTGTADDAVFVIKDEDGNTLTDHVTIAAGENFVDVFILPVDNDDEDDDVTVILTLEDDAAYTVGDDDSDTITIEDDDA